MKRKLSLIAIGIVIGMIISVTSGAFAAVKQYLLTAANYPIVVNGQDYKSTDLPILNYKGSTYVPLRAFIEMTGEDIVWQNGKAIIGENKQSNNSNNNNSNNSNNQTKNTIEETTFEGMRAIKVNNEIYFSAKDHLDRYAKVSYDANTKEITIMYDSPVIVNAENEQHVKIHKSETYINSKFFKK